MVIPRYRMDILLCLTEKWLKYLLSSTYCYLTFNCGPTREIFFCIGSIGRNLNGFQWAFLGSKKRNEANLSLSWNPGSWKGWSGIKLSMSLGSNDFQIHSTSQQFWHQERQRTSHCHPPLIGWQPGELIPTTPLQLFGPLLFTLSIAPTSWVVSL